MMRQSIMGLSSGRGTFFSESVFAEDLKILALPVVDVAVRGHRDKFVARDD